MQWRYGIPVQKPEQPPGFKEGHLLQRGFLFAARLDLKLEQGFSG
jgi:hypothetical protein